MAPEILRRKVNDLSDIWSCGVIMHILLSGYPPFSGRNDYEVMQKIKSGTFSLKAVEWKKTSSEGKALIKSMLTYDFTKRPNAS